VALDTPFERWFCFGCTITDSLFSLIYVHT
jgi:hypothetical protein